MNSIILAFKNFGKELQDALQNPIFILKKYSIASIGLIFIFLIPNLIKNFVDIVRRKGISKDKINRGYIIMHILILITVFIIDYYNVCKKQQIHFDIALKQGLFTIIPLYLFLFLLQLIPMYSKMRLIYYNSHIANILEGFVVFMIYNWVMNFREKYKYNECMFKYDSDIEQTIFDKQKAALKEGKFVEWNNQTMKKPKIETTVTTVTTSSVSNKPPIVNIKNE